MTDDKHERVQMPKQDVKSPAAIDAAGDVMEQVRKVLIAQTQTTHFDLSLLATIFCCGMLTRSRMVEMTESDMVYSVTAASQEFLRGMKAADAQLKKEAAEGAKSGVTLQ